MVDLSTCTLSCVLVAVFAWRVSIQATAATAGAAGLLLGSVYMVWEYASQGATVVASIAQHFQTFARQQADYASADAIREAIPAALLSDKGAAPARWHRLDVHDLSFRHTFSREATPSLDRISLSLCERVDGSPSPEDFSHALRVARADFLDTGALGLEQDVSERTGNWSGGQRSRIALARGVLAARGSSLVLLDDPTASLDPTTEALVYSSLFAEFPDACIVSSVHRLHLLDRFDEVLLMRAGQLVAQASPAALAAGCEEFQEWVGVRKAAPSEEPHAAVAA
ncbi:MAG: hypothetical protein ABI885_24460 [Gammaproteobacteria bacterium]